MRVTIFKQDGTKAYSVPVADGSTWEWKLQDAEHITIRFVSPSVLSLRRGYYCELPDIGRFEIVDLPTPTDNSGAGYSYELKMHRPWQKFDHRLCFFRRSKAQGMEAKFTLTDTITAHVTMVMDNISSLQLNYAGLPYSSLIHDTVDSKKAVTINYDNTSLLSALSSIASAYECEWWIDQNIIHFGKCEEVNEEEVRLEQHLDVTMSRSEDSSEHGTRLYVFGTDRNLNKNYRRKLIDGVTASNFQYAQVHEHAYTIFTLDGIELPEKSIRKQTTVTFGEDAKSYQLIYVGVVPLSDGSGYVAGGKIFFAIDAKFGINKTDGTPVTFNKLAMGYVSRLYTTPIDGQEDIAIQGVAGTVLQLPLGTPYIDSKNIQTADDVVEVVRQLDKVYPRCLLQITEVTKVTAHDTDESTGEVTDWTAYRFKAAYVMDEEKGTLGGPFEFSDDYLTQEEDKNLSIHFESGWLKGLDFEVHFNPDANDDETQLFEITRNSNYTINLPNDNAYPEVGNMLYMYNMDATFVGDELVTNAEMELLHQGQLIMADLEKESGTYSCKTNPVRFGKRGVVLTYGHRVKLIAPEFFHNEEHSRHSRVIGWSLTLDDTTKGEYSIGESAAYSASNSLKSDVDSLIYLNGQLRNDVASNGVIVLKSNDTVSKPNDYTVNSSKRSDERYLPQYTDAVTPFSLGVGSLRVGSTGAGFDEEGRAYAGEFYETGVAADDEGGGISPDTPDSPTPGGPADVSKATWGELANVDGGVDGKPRGDYVLQMQRGGKWGAAAIGPVIEALLPSTVRQRVMTMDNYEAMAEHDAETMYYVTDTRGELAFWYRGDQLLARKGAGEEVASQGFPYTFPIVF